MLVLPPGVHPSVGVMAPDGPARDVGAQPSAIRNNAGGLHRLLPDRPGLIQIPGLRRPEPSGRGRTRRCPARPLPPAPMPMPPSSPSTPVAPGRNASRSSPIIGEGDDRAPAALTVGKEVTRAGTGAKNLRLSSLEHRPESARKAPAANASALKNNLASNRVTRLVPWANLEFVRRAQCTSHRYRPPSQQALYWKPCCIVSRERPAQATFGRSNR